MKRHPFCSFNSQLPKTRARHRFYLPILLLAFPLFSCFSGDSGTMSAMKGSKSGQLELWESGEPVLQYNYWTVDSGQVPSQVSEENRKYARSRSNYIHPLYGLDGATLTLDFPLDHPHHRGIYWAWPEVMCGSAKGDLHALQHVFARPTGSYRLHSTADYAQIDAESFWIWEDDREIVRELTAIRAWNTRSDGRRIDLEFRFTALVEGVSVARRDTDKYGGLNVRLTTVDEQEILFHTEESSPKAAWAQLLGTFRGGEARTGISILQHQSNPDYPGEWVEYPEINWFQPTFPATGTRYELKLDRPLILRFRIWIHKGNSTSEEHRVEWQVFQDSSSLLSDGHEH